MNDRTPKPPVEPRVLTSPRSEAVRGLLYMAQELIIARFALARCLDRLDLHDLLEVFEEVNETLTAKELSDPPRLITPRDERY